MNRSHLILMLALVVTIGLFSSVTACPAAETKAQDRPNILFLFSDDHAPWAVGAAGDPHAVTPNMDRIYREGAVFPNSFTVTPVCSPSRAELMTSRYGSEVGITDWIHPRVEPSHGLDPRYPVWPRLLAEAGYKTGLVGKWHLGTEDRFHPTVFGYQHFMGFRSGGNRPKDPTLEVDGKEQKLKGLLPDILTDNAIEFIQDNAKEPFLLSLHYRAPHAPWLPVADEDWEPYENLDPEIPNPDYPKLDTKFVKKKTREYLASVTSVDRNIGRVLDELDRLNLSDNTVVIYSSDHGYNMGHNGIWHKGNGHWILTESPPGTKNVPKKQRPNMYDNSIRVPMAIRYPPMLKPGTVINETVTNLDWFPTLLDLAGVQVPEKTKIHGRSFVPLMKSKTEGWENDLYCEYSTHHQSKTHMRMYRTENWKLVRDFLNPERHELYDLKNDPAETTNLISSKDPNVKAVIADLHQKILDKMESINDPILAAKPVSSQLMISGNENKLDLHTGGARVVPGGKYPADSISLLDFSTFPPKIQHLKGIPNTVVGPPSNIAITPNHEIALIASSLKLDPKQEEGFGPDDLIHVLDLTTKPPSVIQEVRLGAQPSGMSITPNGKLAVVANRAEGTVTTIRIRGKQVTPLEEIVVDVPESSVSDVAIAPDGKTGLISVQEGGYLAQFKIEGEKVSLTGRKFNTYGRPYRCVITPDGQLGLTAGAGLGDGAPNVDALTVVDLTAEHPHTSSVVTIGAIPESIEVSPDGQLVAAVVMGSSNYDEKNPLFKDDAEVVLLERSGKEYSVVQKLPVGRIPEGVAFTSDGKYLVVQCHVARELYLFEVNGNRLSDTGERISVPGFASSLRAAP